MDTTLLNVTDIQPDIPQILLSWSDLRLSIPVAKGQMKEILKGVSGEAIPGEVLAILGTSGAGKTTLINVLNGWVRNSKSRVITGEVKANGMLISEFEYSLYTGYVLQEDILLATMTVEECLNFSARLKLFGSDAFKKGRAQAVMHELRLSDVKNSRIGDEKLRGISGGEKKRVCIGVELVTNPSLLFLDEPTSGLDSFTALAMMKMVKEQANLGRTVICTLHQPSSQIVEVIDKLIVMSNGHIVYHDLPTNSRSHFEKLGYPFPPVGNPADFLMHIISSRDMVTESIDSRDQKLIDAYSNNKPKSETNLQKYSTIEELKKSKPPTSDFKTQFSALVGRATKEAIRDPHRTRVKIAIAFYLSIIYIILYHDLGKDRESIQNRNGLLFMTVSAMIFTGIDSVILSFPKQRAVFLKEQSSNMYGVLPYYLSKMLLDMFIEFITPTIVFLTTYWACGLNTETSEKPFIFCKL
mmetsp:Transcript_15704/g.28662  ORF Transcript_15704/g.28662 Transcript_15704/m.28662 type:complete len:469 (+) Transcript_15704:1049-2455(+)